MLYDNTLVGETQSCMEFMLINDGVGLNLHVIAAVFTREISYAEQYLLF